MPLRPKLFLLFAWLEHADGLFPFATNITRKDSLLIEDKCLMFLVFYAIEVTMPFG